MKTVPGRGRRGWSSRSGSAWANVVTLGLLILAANPVRAEEAYPTHPIRIIVPFAAGGPSDTAGRIAAAYLVGYIGQNVFVEDRTGGGGIIGTQAAASAPADGYTLFLSDASTFIVVPLTQKVDYDVEKDFVGLGQIANSPQALVVNAQSKFKSVQDLLAFARANPRKLTFGSAGIGTTTDLSIQLLQRATSVSLISVPYRGTSLSVADVLNGNIDAIFGDAPTLAPFVQAGKLRALATTGDTRTPVLPDVPTMIELGFPKVRMVNWFGLHVSSKAPADVVQKLRTAVEAMQRDPKFIAALAKYGTSTGSVGAAAFDGMVHDMQARLAPLIESTGQSK
jgi:tripartite-type tricarboxylate transporter receptor subunit TctC